MPGRDVSVFPPLDYFYRRSDDPPFTSCVRPCFRPCVIIGSSIVPLEIQRVIKFSTESLYAPRI
jgi:hypothetical protein